MKTKLIKFFVHKTFTYFSVVKQKDVKHFLETIIIEYLLITKEENKSRQSDYKQALGFERYHNLNGYGRLQNNF